MDFLYPKFQNVTHKIISLKGALETYPNSRNSINSELSGIRLETNVCVVRENIGYKCEWSEVLVLDEGTAFFNKKIYILNKNLENIGTKKTFEAICSADNQPDPTAGEINILLQETFIPFIDKKNGLYSIRIQTDYERILDNVFFENVLEEIYLEGINILLSSRGFKSDNETINNLRNTYYTFAYINNDLADTTLRRCEPLTLTVSIPLNFFNVLTPAVEPEPIPTTAPRILNFTNKNFTTKINQLIEILLSKAGDFQALTYPNSFIDGFILDFELNSIRKFAVATSNLMEIAGVPLKSNSEILSEYEIGFDNDLNLVFIRVKIYREAGILTVTFNSAMLSQCKLRAEFNSKKIFNYFFFLDDMLANSRSLNALQFLNKYVNYPRATLREVQEYINNEPIPPEVAKQFIINFEQKSESCLNVADITNVIGGGIEFSDTIYSLFVQNKNFRVANLEADLLRNFKLIEKVTDGVAEGSIVLKNIDFDIYNSTKLGINDFSRTFQLGKEKTFTVNSLAYLLSRLNLKQILFERFFCLLKGLDPNARETAQLISELPNEIFNYYNYYQSINQQQLTGTKFLKALARGVSFDAKLFCGSDAESIKYFLKGLTTVIGVGNIAFTQVINYKNELAVSRAVTNPYATIVRKAISFGGQLTIQFLLDTIREFLLDSSCQDPINNPISDNFSDPFGTHVPLTGFNGEQNNNKNALSSNRKNAISYVYPEIVNKLQFGPEVDYTINLLDNLFRDINCILIPQESIELLQGRPTTLIRTLVKNIIRAKYATDPNNLLFLAENDDKLDLFFQRIGLTVDPVVFNQAVETIVNVVEPSTVCSPEVLKAREELLGNKLPKNLGVLEEQLRRRTKKAREVLEKIKEQETTFEFSVLCPEIEDSELENVKDNILQQYERQIRDMFATTLSQFTSETDKIPTKFGEEAYIERREDDKTFAVLQYNTYNFTLAKNLEKIFALNTPENRLLNKSGFFSNKIKYLPQTQKIDYDTIFNSIVTSYKSTNTATVVCPEGSFEQDEKFKNFIVNKNLFLETTLLDETFDDDGFEKDPTNDGDLRDFKDNSEDRDSELGKLLNSKNYFIGITINEEAFDDNYVYLRFIYNDTINNRFKILDEVELQNQDLSDNLKSYLSNYKKYIKTSNIPDREIFGIEQSGFNLLNDTTKNILQSTYNQFYDKWDSKIGAYNSLINSIVLFENLGLFNIEYKLSFDNNEFLTTANVTSQQYDREKRKGIPVEKKFISYAFKPNDIEIIKNIKKSFDISYEYGRPATGFLQETNSSNNSGIEIGLGVSENRGGNELLFNSVDDIYKCLISTVFARSYFISTNAEYGTGNNVSIANENQLYNKISFYKEEWNDDFGTDYAAEDTFQDRLANKDVNFFKNTEFVNHWLNNYSRLTKLDYAQDIRYINCNIYPHYLNLDYYIKLALDLAKGELCDNNLAIVPINILDEIIVNMTARTYVTDILIKSVQFLVMNSRQELLDLYKEKTIIDIVKAVIEKEMLVFSPSQINNLYYKYFVEKCKKVYKRYEENNNLKEIFVVKEEDDKEINYFIRREIRHFIKFSLEKNMFTPSTISFMDRIPVQEKVANIPFLKNALREDYGKFIQEKNNKVLVYNLNDSVISPFRPINLIKNKFTENLLKEQFFSLMLYHNMANIVDASKRTIYQGTKKELADIFGRTAQISENINDFTQYEREQADVIKFINNLAYSPNPAAMVALKPQYGKYVSMFTEAALNTAREVLLTTARVSDPNVALTKNIQFALSTGLLTGWSLIESADRKKLIVDAPTALSALLFKRLEDGKAPLWDVLIGGPLAIPPPVGAGVPMNGFGIAYYVFDTAAEVMYTVKAAEEIEKLKEEEFKQPDPCAVTNEQRNAFLDDSDDCTIEKQELLRKKIDSFEDP